MILSQRLVKLSSLLFANALTISSLTGCHYGEEETTENLEVRMANYSEDRIYAYKLATSSDYSNIMSCDHAIPYNISDHSCEVNLPREWQKGLSLRLSLKSAPESQRSFAKDKAHIDEPEFETIELPIPEYPPLPSADADNTSPQRLWIMYLNKHEISIFVTSENPAREKLSDVVDERPSPTPEYYTFRAQYHIDANNDKIEAFRRALSSPRSSSEDRQDYEGAIRYLLDQNEIYESVIDNPDIMRNPSKYYGTN